MAVGGGEQPVEELEAGQLIKDGLESIPYLDMRLGNTAKETHCTIEKKGSSMKLLECLQDGGEKVKNGEGRGDRHLPLEEGQVFLPSKS